MSFLDRQTPALESESLRPEIARLKAERELQKPYDGIASLAG
jgi:hypothetical protein